MAELGGRSRLGGGRLREPKSLDKSKELGSKKEKRRILYYGKRMNIHSYLDLIM